MSPVVGQADIGCVGQDHQVPVDDARLPQLCHSIQLAAAQDLMAQSHILVLFLTFAPSRQTRTHEKLPVICIGNAIVELFLAYGRMRSRIDHRFLTGGSKLEDFVGVEHQELREEKAPGRFTRKGLPHTRFGAQGYDIKRKRFGGAVVTQKMVQ